jgi:nitrogen fixation NifU-like protein
MTRTKLYDDLVMDHIKNARNYRAMENADRVADGSNPLCGDEIRIFLRIDGGQILDAAYQCTCCGISMASASIMTEQVIGKTVEEIRALIQRFREMPGLAGGFTTAGSNFPDIQAMFETVRQYPSRVRCAVLPWTTLGTLLDVAPESGRSQPPRVARDARVT